MAQIVDVFRSGCEMYEFRNPGDFAISAESFLQKIFDSLDVVVGARFYRFYRDPIRFGEFINDSVETPERSRRKTRHFPDFRLGGKCFKPLDFDTYPQADQSEFAEKKAQRFNFAAIAPIERRKCGKGRERHDFAQGNSGYLNMRSMKLGLSPELFTTSGVWRTAIRRYILFGNGAGHTYFLK